MEKFTYYLSRGHMHYNFDRGRGESLTIQARNDAHLLRPEEQLLWIVLSKGPLNYEEMETGYDGLLADFEIEAEISFEGCLQHLRELELVVTASGEYEIEAKYDLMREVLILPLPESALRRAHIACYLMARKGIPFSDARSLFPKRQLSRQEKEVLALLRKTPLTTAQLVMAVECKSWSAETMRSVMDSIDHDGSKAMKVYSEMMYSAKCLESVLKAVFTLRQDRRIVFM